MEEGVFGVGVWGVFGEGKEEGGGRLEKDGEWDGEWDGGRDGEPDGARESLMV